MRLEAERGVRLPELRVTKPKGTKTSIPTSGSGQWRQPLESTLGRIRPVRLRRVEQGRDHRLWRELVGGYHYLGYRMAFGAQLRYLIEAQEGSRVVGAMGLSSPAWRIAARDEWIGWDDRCRQENLQKIINQSRFLILPWVKIPHLASHVLGQLARRVSEDWKPTLGSGRCLWKPWWGRVSEGPAIGLPTGTGWAGPRAGDGWLVGCVPLTRNSAKT